MPQLELVRLLSGGYKGNKLSAIRAIIKYIDAPISVRCRKLHAAAANGAYLEMMQRTNRQFIDADVIDSYHEDDIRNGNAARWISSVSRIATPTRDALRMRMWNGKDLFGVTTSHTMAGKWLVTEFCPTSNLVIVSPCVHPASRR